MTSSTDSSLTNTPRLTIAWRIPSETSRWSASRTGPRETSKRSARSASPSWVPGASRPDITALRSSSAMYSTVERRGAGLRSLVGIVLLSREEGSEGRGVRPRTREPQPVPDCHLVRGEDRFAQPGLEPRQDVERPHGGVGDEEHLGPGVVVAHGELRHLVGAEGADLRRRVDPRPGEG